MPTLTRLKNNIPPSTLAGSLAALFYFIFSSLRLDAQGLYYDELHQAVGAFAYTTHPDLNSAFVRLSLNGYPLLNMTYSGAIKTALYGLYLKFSGSGFSILSWRLSGILLVSAGLLLSGLILRRSLPLRAALILYFFLATDLTFILTTRFDWGPAALAAFFRLLFIAIWLRDELTGETRLGSSFWLGALVGISVFEKLSSVLLLIGLGVMTFASPQRRTWRHLLAILIGGLLGGAPLIFVNVYSLATWGNLISLHFYNTTRALGLPEFIYNFLSMGAGVWAQNFALGDNPAYSAALETALLLLSLVSLAFGAARNPTSRYFRAGFTLLLAYFATLIGFYYFPQGTLPYHWLDASPFQYAALGLFAAAIFEGQPARSPARQGALALLLIFALVRIWGLVSVGQALVRGDAAIAWDPSLNRLGQFAAEKSTQAVFVSGDWGVGTQMTCMTNNQPGAVYEIQWDDPDAGSQIAAIINRSQQNTAYVIFPSFYTFTTLQNRPEHIRQISAGLAPGWQAQPVDAELMNLKAVTALKFVKVR